MTKIWSWLKKYWKWILLPVGIILFLLSLRKTKVVAIPVDTGAATEAAIKKHEEELKRREEEAKAKADAELKKIEEEHKAALDKLDQEQRKQYDILKKGDPQKLTDWLLSLGKGK